MAAGAGGLRHATTGSGRRRPATRASGSTPTTASATIGSGLASQDKFFVNHGRYVKSGAGETRWFARFVNLGSVSVGAGATLDFGSAGLAGSGELRGHGTLRLTGGTALDSSGASSHPARPPAR